MLDLTLTLTWHDLSTGCAALLNVARGPGVSVFSQAKVLDIPAMTRLTIGAHSEAVMSAQS